MCALCCLAGSLVWANDPARPAGSSPATWVRLGSVRKKNYSKKLSQICDFLNFFYILINIGLYFYIVKIQNRY